jgi:hypothetical protein
MIDTNEVKIKYYKSYMEDLFNVYLEYKDTRVSVEKINYPAGLIILRFVIRYSKMGRVYTDRNYYNIPNKYKETAKELFEMFENMIMIPIKLENSKYANYNILRINCF